MQADLHVHTEFSFDSTAKMSRYCARAVELGLTAVCFTEHFDCDCNDPDAGYFQPEAYFDSIKRVQDEYGDKLVILSGVEISEPQLYPHALEELKRWPFDIWMGSIHTWDQYQPAGVKWPREGSLKERYDRYWELVWNAVQVDGLDVFAHLDFPKRHCNQLCFDNAAMEDIFSAMISKGIVPEINTSPLRKGQTAPMPGRELLSIYRDKGGQLVTTGSDAHEVKDLAKGITEVECMIRDLSLKPIIVQSHTQVFEK